MKQFPLLIFLAATLLIAIVLSIPKMITSMNRELPLPKDLVSLTAFNDAPAFVVDDGRKYRYAHPEQEPYLRFSFPSGPYSDVQLRLSLRAAPRLLGAVFPRGAIETPTLQSPIDIQDDMATFQFMRVSEPATEYHTGRTYIGISFPSGVLTTNDVIELVDFKFFYNLND